MEEITNSGKPFGILCRNLAPLWHSFLLHVSSYVLDIILAGSLLMADELQSSGVITVMLIYVPVVSTVVFQPPQLPQDDSLRAFTSWAFQQIIAIVISPVYTAVSLLKQSIWTIDAVTAKRPANEILNESEIFLSKEVNTYLFLQAYLHCTPQAIFQMYLLILGESAGRFSVCLQAASVCVSLLTVASRTTSLHRYEAQVTGGRAAILLTRHPPPPSSDTSRPLLPMKFCLRNKITALEMDCQVGKIIALSSWFFLIFGRLLCLVISYRTHKYLSTSFLLIHFCLMLFYFMSSQSFTLSEFPSKIFNVTISLLALVEVSVRFYKVPLLYTMFFISIFIQDTCLLILYFVYSPKLCIQSNLDCKYFGVCSYLIMNSHIVGMMLFGIYLAKFRPHKKNLVASISTTSIVSICC